MEYNENININKVHKLKGIKFSLMHERVIYTRSSGYVPKLYAMEYLLVCRTHEDNRQNKDTRILCSNSWIVKKHNNEKNDLELKKSTNSCLRPCEIGKEEDIRDAILLLGVIFKNFRHDSRQHDISKRLS